MALNNLGLGFVFTARDLASGAISNLERNFTSLDRRVGLGTENIQSAFQQLGVGLAVFTAGAATVGAAFSLANAAGRFEQSIAAVAAVSGATAVELEQLRGAAIDAGIATQFSPTEATMGLRELAQAGFNAQESMQLLIPVLDLAAGSLGELSPQQAAGLASQAMKAFGISTDQASISVDRMLQAVNVFALNASELPMALGTASRGAQALHQSLSETLIALGLVKNVIPGVERASTATAVAMERLADPQVQQRLRGIGVAVVDSQGGFRAFLDVLGDMAPALDRMSESQRSAFLLQAFGREALGGVNAILTQVTSGIRTNTGETVRGAQAIAYLRDQFENAGGTAARFREQMLNTFEGQKRLLAGSLETLAIVAGEPFAQVFRPLVTIVVDVVNAVLGVFRQLPAPVKRAFAAFVVGAGAVVAMVGAVIAAKAGIALLIIGLKAAGITLGGLLATILPAVLIFGVLALAVAGFVVAFRNNVGGIADFFQGVGARISLAFRGLTQLFDQGGFSGAVRDELNRAENQGLKDFLINVFLWVNRIRNFFAGIATGFSAGIEAARPTIDAFLNALRRLGTALGFLSERDDAGTASSRFREFGLTGERVGRVLATVFELIVQAMTAVVEVAEGVAQGWEWISAGGSVLWSALSQLGSKIQEVINYMFGSTSATQQNGSAWTALGNVIAFVIGWIISAIGVLVSIVSAAVAVISAAIQIVMSVFSGLADVITGVVFIIGGIFTGSWSDIWMGMKLVAFGVVDAIIGVVLELAGAIAGVVDALTGLFGEGTHWQQGIRDFRDSLRADMAEGMGVQDLTFTRPTRPGTAAPGAPASDAMSSMPAVAAMTPAIPASFPMTPAAPPASPPITVNLQVDGTTLATAVHRADRDSATRSFSPVPAY
ncbi:MAG: phage tail tape measure protein [Deltaproteobacteria bacterium]|jgi:TP901 family phage tail tape measure protein|nr:phage tail tape measure protein [Deltaproteobacteria bacterium]MBN8616503.1 phage tail tape measure protein [Deltaproteobacteria bacterium]